MTRCQSIITGPLSSVRCNCKVPVGLTKLTNMLVEGFIGRISVWLFIWTSCTCSLDFALLVQVSDRFGGHADHVRLLHNCAQSLMSSCAAVHLQQCQMEGFPAMFRVERLRYHSAVRILYNELTSVFRLYHTLRKRQLW